MADKKYQYLLVEVKITDRGTAELGRIVDNTWYKNEAVRLQQWYFEKHNTQTVIQLN